MESAMEQNSVESRSGDAMSIFAESIDVRRPGRSRRRAAAQKILSPEIEQHAKLSAERRQQRRAVVERERARAELELSRATSMAKELERQIEQTRRVKASPSPHHRPAEFHGTRASGGGSRRKTTALVDAPGGGDGDEQTPQKMKSEALYAEVMHELERVKRELRKLQREVRAARQAVARADRAAETPTSSVMSSDGGGKREANEDRIIAEHAEAVEANEERGIEEHAEAKGRIVSKDTSDTESEEKFATASSSEVEDEESSAALLPINQHVEVEHRHHEDDDDASSLLQQQAQAELDSARTKLASVKQEGVQFATAINLTREEIARVREEVARITEQEAKAGAQARQLEARLGRARARLEAAAAEDERAEAEMTEVAAAARRVEEEVGAEVAAAERRVRRAVKELEAARAAEAAAAARLQAAGVMMVEEVTASGDVTVARFEYEYLTGRVEVVRAAAEKKVAAAEAWVEALQAGEKEITMRAEAIEKELAEAMAAGGEAEDEGSQSQRADGTELEPRDDGSPSQQRAPRRRAAAHREREAPAKSGRTRAPARKPSSFDTERKRKTRVRFSCLKVIAGKCSGRC
ncbi:hypothetical protein PR202_gb02017 [Eleusine coracana subsp. coracana]|uniref:Uncharacterized protein n=1 Tax=Eleusine coracana subsp. coracana TaxID=191504 RepID=A0AAV5DY41_ELECO|nr:hypothetical protein PR202_gb02017 [Eleusine coracana subsp. coracana]